MTTELELASRPVASLSKLERQWLRRRVCSFCEIGLLSKSCGGYSGKHTLPIIEGVRDQEEIADLGPPCNMDQFRAKVLRENYKPRSIQGKE